MSQFLTGAQEAEAFRNREYVKLHQSTLKKVENLYIIIDKANDGDLKTDSTLLQQYGLTFQSVFQMMQENWLVAFIAFVVTIIISAFISHFI